MQESTIKFNQPKKISKYGGKLLEERRVSLRERSAIVNENCPQYLCIYMYIYTWVYKLNINIYVHNIYIHVYVWTHIHIYLNIKE